jgi:drug/metabolite transporter (DMT)-like permease
MACLAASASYAVAYVYQGRYLTGRGIPALVLAAGQLAAASVLLLVAAPLTATNSLALTPTVIWSIGALGALGTGAAYILNYRLISDEGPSTASAVTYFLPIVAVALGVIVLSEPLAWNLLIGTTVVLTGVALSRR